MARILKGRIELQRPLVPEYGLLDTGVAEIGVARVAVKFRRLEAESGYVFPAFRGDGPVSAGICVRGAGPQRIDIGHIGLGGVSARVCGTRSEQEQQDCERGCGSRVPVSVFHCGIYG